jgi:hypothetical protein
MVKRFAVIGTFVLSATSLPVQAQTRAYIVASWTEAHRDSAAPLESATDTATKSFVPGGSVSTGAWIMNRLAIEAGITYLGSQSFPWYFTYLLAGGTTSEIASNGDTPVTGGLRAVAARTGKVRLDVVGGAGWMRHRASSDTVGDCGPSFRLPCTPVSRRQSDSLSSWEPTVMFGVDAPIRASKRVAVVPSFRVFAISRRQWLTGYYHRGPTGGTGVMTTFGVGVMFGPWARASEALK